MTNAGFSLFSGEKERSYRGKNAFVAVSLLVQVNYIFHASDLNNLWQLTANKFSSLRFFLISMFVG